MKRMFEETKKLSEKHTKTSDPLTCSIYFVVVVVVVFVAVVVVLVVVVEVVVFYVFLVFVVLAVLAFSTLLHRPVRFYCYIIKNKATAKLRVLHLFSSKDIPTWQLSNKHPARANNWAKHP